MISLTFPVSSRSLRLCILLSLATLPGCSPSHEVAITHKRLLPEKEQEPRTGASSEERFRLALNMAGFGSRPPEARASQPRLAWDTPPGWQAVTGSAMRQADLRFGKNAEGECYVMRAGGSLAANVNRWREQMGLPTLPEEDFTSLPQRTLFGMDAYFVSLEGDYTGAGAGEPRKDYQLLGVILPFPDVSLFVKMVGPKDDVAENEASFQSFCESLRIENR